MRNVKIEIPPGFSSSDIKALQKELRMSQPVFAGIFGYSADAVKAWEEGSKTPNPAVRRLLQMLAANKSLVNQFVITGVTRTRSSVALKHPIAAESGI